MEPCHFLDTLVHQLVFRNRRLAKFTYYCDTCGYRWVPERTSEEITSCQKCHNFKVRSSPQIGFAKEITRRPMDEILNQMRLNYLYYFGIIPTSIVDAGWTCDSPWPEVYAQFLGGDRTTDYSPKTCLVKAVILTPFLWDRSFDWSQTKGIDKVNTDHLGPMLSYFGTDR